eukprot:365525-Chlamydomonas_euryale.AAC.10
MATSPATGNLIFVGQSSPRCGRASAPARHGTLCAPPVDACVWGLCRGVGLVPRCGVRATVWGPCHGVGFMPQCGARATTCTYA